MLVKRPKFETWNWSIMSPNHETSRYSRDAGYWFAVRMSVQIKLHNLIKRNDRAGYVWGNISQLQTISDPGRSHGVHQERMSSRRTYLQCYTAINNTSKYSNRLKIQTRKMEINLVSADKHGWVKCFRKGNSKTNPTKFIGSWKLKQLDHMRSNLPNPPDA